MIMVATKVKSMTTKHSSGGLPRWIDWIVLLIVMGVSAYTIASVTLTGAFWLPLASDVRLSWHLVRAAGLTAYGLLAVSTVWGLFLSSRVIKDWSPGPVSLLLHASASWLAVILSFAHAGLLLFDTYYHYDLTNLLIPFAGPYRALAVGLGTTAAWLGLAITLSFSLRKLIGQKMWRLLHYGSYVTFALVTLHALMAGTDGSKPGMQVVMGSFAVAVVGLFGWRVIQSSLQRKPRPAVRRAPE
jgi:sulfoxide reductase heme-binding subunit YedZ